MTVVALPQASPAARRNRRHPNQSRRAILSLNRIWSVGKVLLGLNVFFLLYLQNTLNLGLIIKSGKTKSLVALQLTAVKLDHYQIYLAPSWRCLIEDRQKYGTSSEVVQADLFIACTEYSCDQVDKEYCSPLPPINDVNSWRQMLLDRQKDELLCYYAKVPEKEDEKYQFAHSLNFLQMEPFLSLLNLNYYDYILRTDADALLFRGLLHVAPDGDGWIGHGYYGEEITDHLVRYFSGKLLPELGNPLRSETATPPMQSTFYIRSGVFKKFVSALLLATQTLHDNAFDKKTVCPTIQNLGITRHLVQGGGDVCHWPLWHKGVSSLYGARIAVDHVLKDVTVTNALDALSTTLNMDDQPLLEAIQAHVMGIKHIVAMSSANITICINPKLTIHDMRDKLREAFDDQDPMRQQADFLFDSIEYIIDHPRSYPATIYYRTADIILRHFRDLHGCNWPLHDIDNQLAQSGEKYHYISTESYNAAMQEIEWAQSKFLSFQEELKRKEEELSGQRELMHTAKEEHDKLVNDLWINQLLGDWCGNCMWHLKTTCDDWRRELIKKQTTPVKALIQAKKHPNCRKNNGDSLT